MSINFIGKLQKTVVPAIASNIPSGKINFGEIQDSVEISENTKILQKKLKEAFEFCQESVKREKPVESQMVFDSTGKILYTNEGDISRCPIEYDKMTPGSIAVHSHPNSCIFSIKDIMAFITKSNIQKIGSVDAQGRTCTLTKPENFQTITQGESGFLFRALDNKRIQTISSKFEVPENPKQFCLNENERQLMEMYQLDSLDELYKKSYTQKTGDIATDDGNIGWMLDMPEAKEQGYIRWDVNDPEWSSISIQYEKVKDKEEGIKIGNELMQSIADMLGLKYQYNPA